MEKTEERAEMMGVIDQISREIGRSITERILRSIADMPKPLLLATEMEVIDNIARILIFDTGVDKTVEMMRGLAKLYEDNKEEMESTVNEIKAMKPGIMDPKTMGKVQ